MDSYPDGREYGSRAKRLKLDVGEAYSLAEGPVEPRRPVSGVVDTSPGCLEGLPTDCDSGYNASTVESLPTPSQHPSLHMDSGHFSTGSNSNSNSSSPQSESFQTLSHADNLDTSQDSVYPEEEEEDDNVSTVSEISGLSDLSGQEWKPMAGSIMRIQKQMQNGVDPRILLSELGVDLDQIPQYVDEMTLWKLILNMLAEPPRRSKLRHVNTLDDVVRLLRGAQNIIVLTGAGVSVSCGIPDFRSRDGIYSRLAIDFPDLPDPQAMFDINYFSQDPRPFFKFARDIYPGKFQPSPCHRFIKLLERHKKLLRNYTQNIDTLERVAQIERVVECHGSFSTATCTKCSHKVTADEIRDTVLAQKIPVCANCQPEVEAISTDESGRDFRQLVQAGIMKPDIVFFGEGLPDLFHQAMADDKNKCDLLLVIGSSLKVRPVALIPSSLPPEVPQILINREPLPHCHFDVELLGDCDVIINHLCQILGWEEGVYNQQKLFQADRLLPLQEEEPSLASLQEPPAPPAPLENKQQTETEPNSSFYQQLIIKRQENVCNCNSILSTNKSSSLDNNKDLKSICTCGGDYDKQRSINVQSKERHMSVDSARDSGIGENSNFTDVEEHRGAEDDSSLHDLRGFWQPKVKRSLVDRLPHDSLYLIAPSRYIFPGAEVYYDPDDKLAYDDSSSDSLDSESECENVEATF